MAYQTISKSSYSLTSFKKYVTQVAERKQGVCFYLMQSQLQSRINLGVHPYYHTGRVNESQC